MKLTEQDREWVRAIVAEAVTEATGRLIMDTEKRFKEGQDRCPHVARLKWFLVGISFANAAGIVGGGVALSSLFNG